MTTFAMPCRFEDGRLVIADPGGADDLQARLVTAVRCTPGDRIATPEFGTVIPVFDESTIDPVDVVLDQVSQWVPDALYDDVDAAVTRVGG